MAHSTWEELEGYARERALRFVDFLLQYQLRRFPPVRDIGEYEVVLTQDDLPEGEALAFSPGGEAWLTVDLVDLPPTPQVPAELRDWLASPVTAATGPTVRHPDAMSRALVQLAGSRDDAELWDLDDLDEQALAAHGITGVVPGTVASLCLAARVELQRAAGELAGWAATTWQPWSERWRDADISRALYKQLFDLRSRLEREREQYELVWGFGRTRWLTGERGEVRVDHPLISVPVEMAIDRRTGQLSISQAGPAVIESSWTVGVPLADRQGYMEQRVSAEQIEVEVWGTGRQEQIRALLRSVDHDGRLLSDGDDPRFGPTAVADARGWVLFVRQRRANLEGFLQAQRALYADGAEVPYPFAALVIDEPSVLDTLVSERAVASDEEAPPSSEERVLLPLPANDEQWQIVSLARSRVGVTAQGPPGTGKSHTIANLISHYLAHGKRVLVTAEKEQALSVLMDKVPEAIRALCVPVLGSDAAGRDNLQRAVSEIAAGAQRKPEWETIARLERQLDDLDARYASTTNLLRATREAETGEAPHRPAATPAETWTPSSAARWVREHAAQLAGIPDELDRTADPPFSVREFIDLERLCRDLDTDDAVAALQLLPSTTELPAGGMITTLRAEATHLREALADVDGHVHSWDLVDQSGPDTLAALGNELDGFARWLAQCAGTWIATVLADAQDPTLAAPWWDFCNDATTEREAIVAVNRHLAAHDVRISLPDQTAVPDPQFWNALSEARRRFAAGRSVGLFASAIRGVLRACATNGHPPATVEEIDLVMGDIHRRDLRRRLRNRWANMTGRVGAPPLSDDRPPEDLIGEHIETVRRALAWSSSTWPQLAQRLDATGLRHPPRPDAQHLAALADTCRTLGSRARLLEVEAELTQLDRTLTDGQSTPGASPLWTELRTALAQQADARWDELLAEARRLSGLRADAARRKHLHDLLAGAAPMLATLIARRATPIDPSRFESAWQWRQLDLWLHDLDGGSQPAQLQVALEQLAVDRRRITTDLVAAKAWVGLAESLDDRRRTALHRFTSANARYGKGTGRYAPKWAEEARQAMIEAQDAVPAWIMPRHKVLTSFRPAAIPPFDVVIVDEASQVGLLDTPLLALGHRAIIVGDDQQTSPQNVGLEQQPIFDLIDDLLGDIRDRTTRFNPQNSLYDIARQRFPQVVQLREHFRCLPRIIEFSSTRWYGGSIVPLRDRPPRPGWQPVGTVFVPSGVRRRSDDTNQAEAEAVADLIAELTADPDYDGMTFGVVTLLGSGQAPLIRSLLFDRFGPQLDAERDLRVGDPASFQGDERDVIILSTVAAHDPERRIGSMTDTASAQRINVAASRARNQLWMVHSVRAEDFHPDDPRRWLLQHCSTELDEAVATATRDKTESDFERAVYDRIRARGYTQVTAQYPVAGYRIDLVVEGPERRLAIECDGDYWHGPDAWDRDRARQTVLERAGWTFERIRGSAFYRDPDAALAPLWKRLDDLGIPTGNWADIAGGRRSAVRRDWPRDFPTRAAQLVTDGSGTDETPTGASPHVPSPAQNALGADNGPTAVERPGTYRIAFTSNGPSAREIREWARRVGHTVGERGRLNPATIAAWNEAFPTRPYRKP